MHTNNETGQLKHTSLASFEYELPSALRQLLLRRAGFLIPNLQIIHDLREWMNGKRSISSSRRRTRADIQYCSPSGRVDLKLLGGLFSKEDIGSYSRSVKRRKGETAPRLRE